ncbi:hypothetical protein D3C75_1321690 [compost metagenome]
MLALVAPWLRRVVEVSGLDAGRVLDAVVEYLYQRFDALDASAHSCSPFACSLWYDLIIRYA